MERFSNSVDFSFVIPCYNVEKFVEDCINSIVNQNFGEITYEIICIEDNSTDNTYEILKKLSESNPNIILHKNECNKGVSYNRNVGINLSHGKWIAFFDSDDLMMPDVINKIYNVAEKNNADCLALKALDVEEDFKINQIDKIDINSGRIYANAICSAIYNNNKLKEWKLLFNENLSFGEDTVFRGLFFLKSEIKIVTDIAWYLRRKNSNSITQTRDLNKQKKIYFDAIIIYETYLENNLSIDVINHAQEGIILKLAQTMDKDFIKKQLKKLKEKNYYPYNFRKAVLYSNKNLLLGILQFLCPIEPFFWMYYLVYKILRKKFYK